MLRPVAHTALGLLAWFAVACASRATDREVGEGGGDDMADSSDAGLGAPPNECAVAADCELFASTCCSCPTFAAPVGAGLDSCDAVECPTPPTCSAATAACDHGRCALRCPALVTTRSCPAGFDRDVAGCLMDACLSDSDEADAACAIDDDCAQVPADCCGCGRGGADTAVPLDEVDDHETELACEGGEACPSVDVCEPAAAPRCVAERCVLLADGPLALCGTPDLLPCPVGSSCLLNAEEAHDAAALGVGTCHPGLKRLALPNLGFPFHTRWR